MDTLFYWRRRPECQQDRLAAHDPLAHFWNCGLQPERALSDTKPDAYEDAAIPFAGIVSVKRKNKWLETKGEMKRDQWGSQIRSYVFQPYTMAQDHRTGFESGV